MNLNEPIQSDLQVTQTWMYFEGSLNAQVGQVWAIFTSSLVDVTATESKLNTLKIGFN